MAHEFETLNQAASALLVAACDSEDLRFGKPLGVWKLQDISVPSKIHIGADSCSNRINPEKRAYVD